MVHIFNDMLASPPLRRHDSYSKVELSARLTAAAVGPNADTAIPKLPEKASLHPGGAAPVGEIFAVTACGNATGFAVTMAATARIAREYCIMSILVAR